jgi:hypothetical protein
MDRHHVAIRANDHCDTNSRVKMSEDTISQMKKKRNTLEDISRCLWLRNLGYGYSQIAAEMRCDQKHARVLVRVAKYPRQLLKMLKDDGIAVETLKFYAGKYGLEQAISTLPKVLDFARGIGRRGPQTCWITKGTIKKYNAWETSK